MASDGTGVRRLTFEGEFHDEATVNSDATHIICTTRVNGRFQLAQIDIATGRRTVIHGPGSNESPTFSPEGSMIAFASSRTGQPQVFVTDADGTPHQLTSAGQNHSPAWTGAPNSP